MTHFPADRVNTRQTTANCRQGVGLAEEESQDVYYNMHGRFTCFNAPVEETYLHVACRPRYSSTIKKLR